MQRILIFGATSAIASATAERLARGGAAQFVLVGRDAAKLAALAGSLSTLPGVAAQVLESDLRDRDAHATLITRALELLGELDIVIVAHGVLPDQDSCERDADAAIDALDTNLLSPLSLLTHVANALEKQRRGSIVVIGSVAGDRGRQSNYVYGSAKAGLHAFVQGLRNRLHRSGVHVLTVKPGLVESPMTAHLKKNRLFSRPENVARHVERGLRARRHVIYAPAGWRYAMFIIRAIPESIFKRLRL